MLKKKNIERERERGRERERERGRGRGRGRGREKKKKKKKKKVKRCKSEHVYNNILMVETLLVETKTMSNTKR